MPPKPLRRPQLKPADPVLIPGSTIPEMRIIDASGSNSKNKNKIRPSISPKSMSAPPTASPPASPQASPHKKSTRTKPSAQVPAPSGFRFNHPAEWGLTPGIITVNMAKRMVYPWKNRYFSFNDVLTAVDNLANYKLNIDDNATYKLPKISKNVITVGTNKLIITSSEDYSRMNFISDMFVEDIRIQCKRFDMHVSPWNKWYKDKDKFIADVAANGDLTLANLNAAVRKSNSGCGNFRSSLVAGFIEMYGAKSVLDISAGWGDRLIACIVKNVRYVGFDPNTALRNRYDAIINHLESSASATVITAPFETADLSTYGKFDMVFSSPPFFDLEIYSTEDTQSNVVYPEYEAWVNGFLKPSLDKAWSALNSGGYMVISMNNVTKEQDIVGSMIEHMKTANDADLYDFFAHQEAGRKSGIAQPMFVWRKD